MLRMPEALTVGHPTVLLRNVEALLEQVRVETTLGPAVEWETLFPTITFLPVNWQMRLMGSASWFV